MTPTFAPNTNQWIGFQVFTESPVEEFLVADLPAFVRTQIDRNQISRFFFLRYSEGGPHLRLRFRTTPETSIPQLEEGLNHLLLNWSQTLSVRFTPRLVPQAYDRTQLYFGESLLSVYAELMHEQTSWLAIELLASMAGQASLRLLILYTLRSLLVSIATPEGRSDWLSRWAAFSSDTARVHRQPILIWQSVIFTTLLTTLDTQKTPQWLSTNRHLSLWQTLMTRLLRTHGGYEVSVHAVHLLCNKVGLSLTDESNLCAVLQASLRSHAYAA